MMLMSVMGMLSMRVVGFEASLMNTWLSDNLIMEGFYSQ